MLIIFITLLRLHLVRLARHYFKLTLVPLPGSLVLNNAKGLCLLSVPGENALLNASWLSVK
jgi:hypothetical protein